MHWIMLALAILGQAPASGAQKDNADSYLMGKADSPVRIEIFSDFQCPMCRTFYLDTVTRLLHEYAAGDKVAVIFRDFPLQQHPASRIATRYALASKSLGRDQWAKVIEYLYTCQAEWSYDGKMEPVLSRILDPAQMQTLKGKANDPAIEQAIDHEVELGNERKVDSTPTIFFTAGGKEQRMVGGLAFPAFKEFIDRSLK
ncbi:MAG TPA: thioredoxin domain-containing protein [Spirochaetia bacterium]|nr:thioredoxin domain-containing protein [Spirochaetia bacterium]